MYKRQGEGLYVYDAAAKDIYQVDANLSNVRVFARGSNVVSQAGQVKMGSFESIFVTSGGRVAGLLNDGGLAVYAGGATFMERINVQGTGGFNYSILWVAAIAVGVILLTILIFDAYVAFFKMRISIMVRQAILIVISIVGMLYILINFIITPSLESTLADQYYGRILSSAQVMVSAIESLGEEETEAVFSQTHTVMARKPGEVAPLHFDLLSQSGKLIVSTDGYRKGFDGDVLPMRIALKQRMGTIEPGGHLFTQAQEAAGSRMYAMVLLDDGRCLVASVSADLLTPEIESIMEIVSRFLVIVGVVIILAFMLVEYLTVHSIRKLKKGVDAVSAGDYSIVTHINSGDEVESLSNSFNTMTRFIRHNVLSLERINRAYYRFVPENLVRILGENSVENLGKDSHVKRRMVVMVVEFTIEAAAQAQSAEGLFTDINQVMERIAPAVAENGGTVYDFKYDGFHAVFDQSAESAVLAALQIREVTAALGAERRSQGRTKVDVRVVLDIGDVMLGIIGDENRMSPTAISDSINNAGAILSLCRGSDIYIGCSEAVAEEIKGYRIRYVGKVRRRGEEEGMKLFDLYDGDPYALLKHKEMVAPQFDEAVRLFYKGDFEKSRYLFMQIVSACLDDGAARNYMYYADLYRAGEKPEYCYRLYE